MAEINFNTPDAQEIDRELLVLCVNVSSSATPEWCPVGCGVESSSAEYDWQRESRKDILGATHNSMKKPIITQSFDPWPLAGGDKAQKYIWEKAVKDHDAMALSNMDLLVIHKYAGTRDTSMFGERYPASAVEVTGFGGEGGGSIAMPITATFGGTRTTGNVSIAESGVITYTAG